MAFPFDFLDVFIPEIAQWMAGKSTSEKRRFLRAGVGLLILGLVIGICNFFSIPLLSWLFDSSAWTYFLAFQCFICGVFLLLCVFINKATSRK